jgi:anti-anti-sigma factor
LLIETYFQEDIKIIKLCGEINFDNYIEFGECLSKAVEKNKRIILVMDELIYLNSVGLSIIVKQYTKIKKEQGEICLCCLNKDIMKLFTITKLDKIITIKPLLKDAIDFMKV